MPEGDSIHRLALRLNCLVGESIVKAERGTTIAPVERLNSPGYS